MNQELQNNSYDIIHALGGLNSKFSGKQVLLTGAAGFLGCQFVHYFKTLNEKAILDSPCHLYAWDNYMLGLPSWLENLKDDPSLTIQKKDVIYDKNYPEADFIIHAASIASPTYYRKYPIETIEANIFGLKNLLDYCIQSKVEGFLFFSTSEIYGDPNTENIPTGEEYRGNVSCTGPRACYDESKRLGETLCVNYFNIHKVPVKIVRPFNNYGPGLKIDDKRVIPDFFNNVINNKNIVIHSDGNATRTFCYISDAIEGYIRVLLSDFNGHSFNIGNDSPEITIEQLAKKIIDISGKQLKIKFQPNPDSNYLIDNPKRRCPLIEKAKNLINFNPKVSLQSGLERTYQFYLAELE